MFFAVFSIVNLLIVIYQMSSKPTTTTVHPVSGFMYSMLAGACAASASVFMKISSDASVFQNLVKFLNVNLEENLLSNVSCNSIDLLLIMYVG